MAIQKTVEKTGDLVGNKICFFLLDNKYLDNTSNQKS